MDEAGRGALVGPVIAAAVILDEDADIAGLADSKVLAARRREQLAALIRTRALAWAIGRADHVEIDKLNILEATMLAMARAIEGLKVAPNRVLADGNRCPRARCEVTAVIGGDRHVACISAASILAKVTRDKEMQALERQYPGYGFAAHKGYATRRHLRALAELGACPLHRRSFAPVRRCAARPDLFSG